MGKELEIIYGYMCEKRARTWSRQYRQTNRSTGKPGRGVQRRAARLPINGLHFHQGLAVLVEGGTSIAATAPGLGLRVVMHEEGIILSLDPNALN